MTTTAAARWHAETNRPLGVMPEPGDVATLDGDTITVRHAALVLNGADDRPEVHLTVWHDVVGAEVRVILWLTDEAAHVANESITAGRVNVSTPEHRATPLDVLVGDVVACDAGWVLVDHIITWDANEPIRRVGEPGHRERRVAACSGRILATFPGGPTTRWNVQGNDLRRLSTVLRAA